MLSDTKNPTTWGDEYIVPFMIKENSLTNSVNREQVIISEESLKHLEK